MKYLLSFSPCPAEFHESTILIPNNKISFKTNYDNCLTLVRIGLWSTVGYTVDTARARGYCVFRTAGTCTRVLFN